MNPSRREFLGGAAVTAMAVASGANLATTPATVEAAEKATVARADETIETQIVVVGSGLGGFAAAMTAMEEGARKVVMLEKESIFGGQTNWASSNGPGQASEAQARRSAAMSMKNSSYIANPMLHYHMSLDQKEDKDWLFVKHQVQYELRANDGTVLATNAGLTPAGIAAAAASAGGPGGGALGGGGPEGGAPGGAPGVGAPGGGGPSGGRPFYAGGHGSSCIKTLTPQAQALGVDMRLNMQAVSLIMKDPYTCTGVRAKTKEGKITSRCWRSTPASTSRRFSLTELNPGRMATVT